MAVIDPTAATSRTGELDYDTVRATSQRLAEALAVEDFVAQSAPEVSPAKWHLAHTSWFFETFVLRPHVPGYRVFNPAYEYLFNSYYNAVGPQYPRPNRGAVTRPTVSEVFDYRAHVDEAMRGVLPDLPLAARDVATLGLHHEQQHQELMLMDLKHVFSCNPLHPAYGGDAAPVDSATVPPLGWLPVPEGVQQIGDDGAGFAYDNERPRHRVYLHGGAVADRLVTNDEYRAFVEDGGYERPDLWLSDGRDWLHANGVAAPLYWQRGADGCWYEHTLAGLQPLDPARPVTHVSFYEAEVFASWMSARLPTEAEWEAVAAQHAADGHFVEAGAYHPRPPAGGNQLLGDCWEWTRSDYAPYPGYRPPAGALGEYNGKFMCNQYVLRGGSCVTSASHMRLTYRNFFYPSLRWVFAGIRLALDA